MTPKAEDVSVKLNLKKKIFTSFLYLFTRPVLGRSDLFLTHNGAMGTMMTCRFHIAAWVHRKTCCE